MVCFHVVVIGYLDRLFVILCVGNCDCKKVIESIHIE
jgi:hypothetical protein